LIVVPLLKQTHTLSTFDLHDCRILSAENETGKSNTFCVVNFSTKAVIILLIFICNHIFYQLFFHSGSKCTSTPPIMTSSPTG